MRARVGVGVGIGALIIGSAAVLDCSSFSPGNAQQQQQQVGDGGVEATDGPGLDASVVDSGGTTAVDAGCNGRLDCERTVFITKDVFTGAFGGIEMADEKCNAAADVSPLANVRGRRYRAFLSDATTPAEARIPHGESAYKRPDGHVVQQSWKALIDGPLLEPINHAEDDSVPSTLVVWTGLWENCWSWGSLVLVQHTDAIGTVGSGGVTTPQWMAVNSPACSTLAHLYCFEY